VWRLPDSPLRASALTAKLLGLVALVALASAARTALPLGDRYPLKAAGLFAAVMGLSIGFLRQHHPFTQFGAANQITTLRAMLVALVAGLVGEPRVPAVAMAAAAASVAVTALDGVDGWLARRQAIVSRFGARFDMETDALLILVLSALAWRWDRAGAWVLACGLMRYAFVAAAWAWPWMARPLPPSWRRKFVCVVQIVGLALVVAPVGIDLVRSGTTAPFPLAPGVAAITLAMLTWSFAVDVWWLAARRSAP